MVNMTKGEKVFQVVNMVLLVLISFATIYPLLYSFALSFSSGKYISAGLVRLWPLGFNMSAYIEMFKNNVIVVALKNSFLITIIGTSMNMVMTVITAYPLSKKNLVGRKYITMLILFTMWLNGGIIPSFILLNSLKMTNTWFSVWMPTLISVFNLIIMRKAFEGIPNELEESAIIDGCNQFQVFARIALPLTKATLAALTLFYAVYHWNSFICAVMFITDRKKWPIQVILREIVTNFELQAIYFDELVESSADVNSRALQSATTIVAIVPILLVYPFLQKHFVKGVMLGSVKG